MAHRILTINRLSGSGGSYIGAKVAEEFGINFYDKDLLTKAIELGGLDKLTEADLANRNVTEESDLAFYGKYGKSRRSINTQRGLFEEQKKLILEIAAREDAVIVGRYSGWLLQDEDVRLLKVCIVGNLEDRVQRIMENSDMNKIQANLYINKTDRLRFENYRKMTGQNWNGFEAYQFVMNSSRLGVDKCIDLLCTCYRTFLGDE